MSFGKPRHIGWTLLAMIALFTAWYLYAADYSYRAISGTYVLRQGTSRDVLTLRADRTFTEDATGSFPHSHSEGTWQRIGEGGVALKSVSPLNVPAKQGADGTIFAEAKKSYQIRPSLEFNNGTTIFKKRFF